MFNDKIAVIGCGNLGQSIVNGLIQNGINPNNIIATRRNLSLLQSLKDDGVIISEDNLFAVKQSSIILLGLKPYTILDVLEQIKNVITDQHIIVSLATGVTINQIEEIIGTNKTIFRAMPNTASDVGESLTCICGNNNTQNEKITSVFDSIGETIIIDENLMESATVLGACGIAYALRFMRGMIQGGIQIGFDAETAGKIVNQTVKGATELLIQRQNHPEHEIDKVTTPRGCTIEGLNEMEHHGFSSALIKGIVQSFKMIEK